MNCEDIYLEYCRIVGEVSVSKKKLETDLIKNLSIIKDNLVIKNSTLESKLNLSNVQFNNSADFHYANFYEYANFSGAIINDTSNFIGLY